MIDNIRMPGWVVIDDSGADVLLVDAARHPSQPLLIPDRTAFFRLLDALRGGATRSELAADPAVSAVFEKLDAAGMLVHRDAAGGAWGRLSAMVEGSKGEIPLGHWQVEMPQVENPERLHVAFLAAFERLLDSERELRGVVLRFGMQQFGEENWNSIAAQSRACVDNLVHALTSRSRTLGSWICEFPAPANEIPTSAHKLLETAGRCRVIISAQDSDQIPSSEEVLGARRLANEGFECIVEMSPRFTGETAAVVERWLDQGRCSAVRVSPLLPSLARGATDRAELAERMTAGIHAMAEIAQRLGVSVHRSQPWRSILTGALIPLAVSAPWSKSLAHLYISEDGKYSRSRVHAMAGIHVSLEDALPASSAAFQLSGGDCRLLPPAEFAGAPACAACGFAPLCDKFANPQIEVARLAAREDIAAELARFECETRKVAIGALLDSLREQARDDARAGDYRARTTLRFEKSSGAVQLETT